MMKPRKYNPMRRMLKRAARARSQHGIALLFTLCILSMALITAMILSSAASTSRKVAAVQVDSTAARILADGVVGRAVLGLMQSNAAYACSNYNTVHPKNGTAKEYASDWIWKLEKDGVFTFDKGPIRFSGTYYNISEALCPSWEYVYDFPYDGGTATKNERIFGRYAYVAIGQNDQLNPNAIGKRDYSDYDDTIRKKRLGRYTCEPEFKFLSVRNGWNYDSNNPVISPNSIVSKYLATGGDGWTEQDLFDNAMASTSGGPASDKAAKMMLDQYFDVSGKPEYNKFSPTGKAISAPTKHATDGDERYRFPIIRTDWNSIEVGDVKSGIPWFNKNDSAVDQTVANLINYNATFDRPPVTNADWRTGEPSYTGNKRTPYINEVSAEIAVGGKLGFRVPRRYLTDSEPPVLKWAVKYTDCSYSHEITVHIETVNMFKGIGGTDGYSAYPVSTPILFGGEVSYQYWIQNQNSLDNTVGSWKTVTVPFEKISTEATVVTNGSDNGYQDYVFTLESGPIDSITTPERDNYDKAIGHDADFYEFFKIKNVKVNLDRVILLDMSGRNADLALMPTQIQTGKNFFGDASSPAYPNGEIACGPGDSRKRFYLHAQVNDPRFNLGRDQWSDGSNEFISTTFLTDTIGSRNEGAINLGTYHDNEKESDPVYNSSNPISTAYIRHGQMESLWELGAIHRGAPWQTINLKCAKNTTNVMDRYDYGDGNLLDQVALATRTDQAADSVIGMINLNCVANFGNSPFTFKSLFTGFPIYKTFVNLNDNNSSKILEGNGVDSENSDADVYAAELSRAVACAVANGFAPRRTSVFPETYPAGSANPMTHIIPQNVPDAESEEIFCRVVNLLKWNKQQTKRATILVLAQTIQDVGGKDGGVLLRKVLPKGETDLMRDAGFMAFDSTSKRTTDLAAGTVSGYAQRNAEFKKYDNFYDQITGEAKIIVHMEWDESAYNNKGAWKVTRKEYAE